MGARGPAPSPAKLRLLKGDGRSRDADGRKVRPQPTAVPGAPDAPPWLSDEGRWLWDRVAPELERMGVLGRLDVASLAAACDAWSRFRAHDGGRGWSTVSAELRQWLVQLGLTPAARLRMTLPEAACDDDEAVFGG